MKNLLLDRRFYLLQDTEGMITTTWLLRKFLIGEY